MSSQLFTLIGTLSGAIIGMCAPVISSAVGNRHKGLDRQREIANEIMVLFEDGASPSQVLSTPESAPRRRLYLYALRLQDKTARNACMEVIAAAGERATEDDVLIKWNEMMSRVGEVYRTGRSDRP